MASATVVLHASDKDASTAWEKDPYNLVGYFDYETDSVQPLPHRQQYAVVVYPGMSKGHRFTIKSDLLRAVLGEINEGVENTNFTTSNPQVEHQIMFHSYPALKERLQAEISKSTPDETLIAHLKAGILSVDHFLGDSLRAFHVELKPQGQITYDLLWALFKPNSLVYYFNSTLRYECLFKCRSVQYDDHVPQLDVFCDMIHDDGDLFGYARVKIAIPFFKGAVGITDLVVHPLEYRDNESAVRERAVENGKTYMTLRGESYREYHGVAIRDDDRGTFHVSGRVMFSAKAFKLYAEDERDVLNPGVPNHKILDTSEEMTDEQYAICSAVLLGFAFEQKTWGAFALARQCEFLWNEAAFNDLVLDDSAKRLVLALIRNHAAKESDFDDIISGKGLGLVGLLAGPPGCGKTLTAEAVAETTHRPLYMLSAGELGTSTSDVETALKRALELAHRWNAVLLLDEAEVFLQQRDRRDIHRNALVSIFLRQLEYYDGIIILTTNMPDQIDAAFESRVHFSIGYPDLARDARQKIWKRFLARSNIEMEETAVAELASHDINGRQIKNAFSSALTIAADAGSTLGVEHIEHVLKVLSNWKLAKEAGSKLGN